MWESSSLPVDNATLCVSRFIGDKAVEHSPIALTREVVLLSAGFGNNVEIYDLLGTKSLPNHLFNSGYDVWTLDYRNHGKSVVIDRKKDYDMGTYAFTDALSVIAFVLEKVGQERLHWIGHSMGGMIGLTLASYPHTASKLSSVTALGSSLYLQHSIYWWVFNFTPLNLFIRFNGGIKLDKQTNLASRFFSLLPCLPSCGLLDKVSSRKNTGYKRLHTLLRGGFCYESLGVVKDLIGGMRRGGSISPQGPEDGNLTHCASVKENIGLYCKNIALIYGTDDYQIHEKDVLKLSVDIQANCKASMNDLNLLLKGVGKKKQTKPYSHFDMILGDDAPIDLFPEIIRFLKVSSAGVNKIETGDVNIILEN